jgi:hypothetical protein
MAQVDFVNYFSILFWFFLLFIIYYLINYSILLPSIYSIIFIRHNVYKELVTIIKLKFNSYIKNLNNYYFLKNNYITFLFFLKKNIYIF